MGNLLHFEFRKLFRQKSFYICGAVLLVMVIISVLSVDYAMKISADMAKTNSTLSSAISGNIELTGLYCLMTMLSGSGIAMILAIFVPLFVCGDYSNGTIKNVIAKGYPRTRLFAAKYIVSVVAAVVMSILCWLTAFLTGTALAGIGSGWNASILLPLLAQLIVVCSYVSLFFMISVLIKKTGAVLAVGIVAPMVITLLISFLDYIINSKSFKIADYWLSGTFANVSAMSVANDILIRSFISAGIYLIVPVVIGLFVFRKSEV